MGKLFPLAHPVYLFQQIFGSTFNSERVKQYKVYLWREKTPNQTTAIVMHT